MAKIALITGGSRGLGKTMALLLADKARDSIITYHSRRDEAGAVVKAMEEEGQKAVALQLDVTKSDTFADFVETVKPDCEGRQLGRARSVPRIPLHVLFCGSDRFWDRF